MKKFGIALIIIIVLLGLGYLLLAKQRKDTEKLMAQPQKNSVSQSTTPDETPHPTISQEEKWCKTLKDPQARARACKMAQQRRALKP